MSSDKAHVCDEHKYPFSLVSEFKHGHNRDVTKVGDVTELMDKAIGRLVFRVKGSVSATNYVEFDSLNLFGPILYLQMCLAKPSIATIHLEIKTTSNIPLRLTLSTLYNGDQPRFLGRSLRLPLPAVPGWMVLAVDLNQILSTYCLSGPKGSELQLKAIQKIQLCSNMLLRDIVTSDKEIPLETKYLPKELAVKPLPASQGLQFIDLVEYCASIQSSTGLSTNNNTHLGSGDSSAQSSPDVDTKVRAVVAQKMAALGLSNNVTTATATGVSTIANKSATQESINNNQKNNQKHKSIRRSDHTSDTFQLNHALLHQAFPPPPPTPAAAASTVTAGPVLSQPEVQTPLASAPARAGSARRSTTTGQSSTASSNNNSGNTLSSNKKQLVKSAPTTESVSAAKSPVRPPVTLKQMNLSTVTSTAVSSTTVSANNESVSAQLSAMFEEVNTSVQEKTTFVQNNKEVRINVPAPVSANANNKYALTSVVNRPSSATRIRTSRTTTTSTSTTTTSVNIGNNGGTGSSVLHSTVLSKALTTPRHIPLMQIPTDTNGTDSFNSPGGQTTPQGRHHTNTTTTSTGNTGVVKYTIPETLPGDRVLQLERLLGYSGGPAVLLYEGRMLLLATGSLLVMVDLDKEGRPVPTNGLFRAFKSVTSLGTSVAGSDRELGFKQSFLRGHAHPIGLIEVSEKEMLMVTGETSTVNGALILWDAREGRRLATLHPHTGLLQLASFSTDGSLLVTVGTDQQFRQQIIVWDIAQLIAEKTVNILHLGAISSSTSTAPASGASGAAKSSALVAKQISEFPVLKIRFSPFEEFGLVSCGRENIRFWRIRKGHLPGRPVLLNEYARGFTFQDIAFHSDAGATPRDPRRPAAYFASNKGLVLRVDCTTDQIICAYQLHPCSIRTLCIHSGYAVTGAEDNKLRLWPLDFTDFLLEAQHEGCVTQIHVALDGRKLCIGTDAGTLGVLNVSEHSYSTVLRSHCGSVNQVVPCLTGAKKGLEFATVGKDNTVRIWDAISGNQVIEFTSEKDRPTCSAYHPASDRYIACGYQSGHLRVFDVTTATAALEVRVHAAAVVAARYIHRTDTHHSASVSGVGAAGSNNGDGACILLATASLDGTVCIHDASEGGAYLPIKRISFGGPTDSILLQVSDDSLYLAVGASLVGSLTVFETKEFVAILRLSAAAASGSSGAGGNSPVPNIADFPTATVQSTTYLTATAATTSTTTTENDQEEVAVSPDAAATPAAHTTTTATSTTTAAAAVAPTATAEYLMSPTHRATASSAASATTANTTNANHNGAGLYAPLVGVCFAKDRMGGALLIVTDKHIISVGLGGSAALSLLASPSPASVPASSAMSANSVSPSAFFSSPSSSPLPHSEHAAVTPAATNDFGRTTAVLPSKRAVHAWEERLSKRLDCGIPVSVTRDASTGLLFIAIRPPVAAVTNKSSNYSGIHTSIAGDMGATFRSVAGGTGTLSALSTATGGRNSVKSGNNKISDVANAFAVIDVRHRTAFSNASVGANAKRERLSVSVPQLYLDLPGPVEGICPCGEAGKVATVDANGTISLWHLRAANIAKVKVDLTAPSPSDGLLHSAQQSREYRSSGSSVARNLASTASHNVSSNNGNGVASFHTNITEAIIEEESVRAVNRTSDTLIASIATTSSHCETVDTTVSTPFNTTGAGAAPCTPGTAAVALTRDFERAVLHDPSMWSAASSSSATSLISPAAQIQALAQLEASQQVRSDLYEHNIGSPDAKKIDSFPLRQSVNSEASTKSPTNKTRMSTKASAEKSSASSAYDSMFQEEQNQNEAHREVIFVEEEEEDKTPAVMDLSGLRSADTSLISAASHAHRSVATHAVTTTKVAALPAALTSEPIDNPLAGLNVWLEMQSPAGKSLRSEHQSPKKHSTHNGHGNTDDAEEDSEGEESSQVSRHLDSLDLLQRARTNMNASRLGDSLAAAQSGTTSGTASALSGVPLTYFTQPVEATQHSNLIAVNYANAVAPNFCQSKSMLLTSDGASVVIKYINTGDQLVLGFPAPLTYCRAKCIITDVKLHESENMIAALVRTSPKSVYYLVTWVLVGAGEVEDGTFVPSAAEWRCMGFADLGVVQPVTPAVSVSSGLKVMAGAAAAGPTLHDHHHQGSVCLEWTPTGSLLVLTSQDGAGAESAQLGANGLLKFTLVPPEVIYAGTLNVNWDDVNQVVQSPLGRVLGVKALPGVVVEEPFRDIHAQVPTVHVVVYGESRTLMAALTVTAGRHGGWARDVAQVVWSDDLGARGPILAVDAAVCPPHCISSLNSSSDTTATSATMARRSKASHTSGSKADSALRNGGRGLGRDATDSLVAVLDSCGSVKFSLFSFYQEVGQEGALDRLSAPFVRSVTTKVPAANASGALRTLSLFAPQTRRAPHFLALAGTHDVRLCTLALRELNSKSVAVSLTVLYKVSLQSPPDYLLSIQPVAYGSSAELSRKLLTQMGPVGQAPHLFVSNHQGYSGFVPNVRWLSGRHLPSACLTLQSAPLHCPAGSTVTDLTRPCHSHSKRGELLAALVKGQVHLYHGGSGIKLPFAGCKGISHGTSLLPLQHHSHQLFAVGSRCGRVVLFDADLLQQQELVILPSVQEAAGEKAVAAKDSTKTSANALFKKAAAAAPRERASKTHAYSAGAGAAVTSLRSAARGRLLLAAQESGAVSVIEVGCANRAGKDGLVLASIFAPSVVNLLPTALYQDHSALQHLQVSQERLQNHFQHTTVLATVAGEARLSGVIRKHSNVLELYFQDDHVPVGHTGHAPVQLHNFLNVSLKTPQDLDLHDEKESSAYFAASQSKHAESAGADIAITACHVIVTERTYVISIVGRQVPSHNQHHVSAEQAAAAPVYLYSGSVTLPDVPSVTASTVRSIVRTAAHNRTTPALDVTPYLATLRQRVLLDELPALTSSIASTALMQGGESTVRAKGQHWEVQNSVSFCGRHCAVVTAEVVYVVDLLKVYTSAPGSEVSALCTSMVASQITSLGATSFSTASHPSSTWADSAALLSVEVVQPAQLTVGNEDSVVEDQSLHASTLSLVVYRRHKPAMFKFHIKCE